MAEAKLTAEKKAELFRRRRQGEPVSKLAQEYGYKPHYLANLLYLEGVLVEVRPSSKPRYNKPPRFPADCLILCDCHIPYHDAKFINTCLSLALAWKLPNLLLAGDVMDMAALSQFSHRPEATLRGELGELKQFFDVVAQQFQQILMLLGNHERRFLHFLKEELRADDILRLVDEHKVAISEYSYAFVDKWLVGHPRNVSVIPGRIPFFLARKYPGVAGVASGHGHLAGMAYCEDGQRLAVDIGCSVDDKKLDWIAEHLSTRPGLAQGALVLKQTSKGIFPWWLHRLTDFEALKRAYAVADS